MQLSEWLISCQQKPFKWGQWDCAIFVSEWLTSQGYADFTENYKNRYKSPKGAATYLQKTWNTTKLENVVDQLLGQRKSITFAKAGDVVCKTLSNDALGKSLGICNGSVSWFLSDDGLVQIPTLECDWSWYG